MKKILFPFDFSESSLNAFRYALHLADKIGAEILTLHAYEDLSIYTDYYNVILANYQISELTEFDIYKNEVPNLTAIAEEENLSHIHTKHLLHRGEAAESILEVAKSPDILFIVMGTSGASGLQETFIGSVTEEVINNATCSVLAVPSQALYHPIHKVLLLSKYKPTDMPIVRQAYKLAELFGAHLSVLHVRAHHDEYDNERLGQFRAAFSESDIRFHILVSNATEDTINDFMDMDDTDILIVTVRHKNFFQNLFLNSLSRQLVFHSKIPLLSIPKTTKN